MNLFVISFFVSILSLVQFCAVSELVELTSKPRARRLLSGATLPLYLRKNDRTHAIDVNADSSIKQLYAAVLVAHTPPINYLEAFLILFQGSPPWFKKEFPHLFSPEFKFDRNTDYTQRQICDIFRGAHHIFRDTCKCNRNGKIDYLILHGFNNIDLSQLRHFTELRTLQISQGSFVSIDLSPLASSGCKTLEYLRIRDSGVLDLDLRALSVCKSLLDLEISRNPSLRSIKLPTIDSLDKLTIASNPVLKDIDLKPLSQCDQLTSIDLRENRPNWITHGPFAKSSNHQIGLQTILFPESPNWNSLRYIVIDNNILQNNISPLKGILKVVIRYN
eukprot:245534_1